MWSLCICGCGCVILDHSPWHYLSLLKYFWRGDEIKYHEHDCHCWYYSSLLLRGTNVKNEDKRDHAKTSPVVAASVAQTFFPLSFFFFCLFLRTAFVDAAGDFHSLWPRLSLSLTQSMSSFGLLITNYLLVFSWKKTKKREKEEEEEKTHRTGETGMQFNFAS